MNFKSQNPIDASQSERFKLYKSGKLWLVAGLTFFSFLGGSVLNNTNVHADVTTATTTSSSAASTASSASVATSSAASDATTKATSVSSSAATQVTSAATTKTTSQAATASSSAATSQSTVQHLARLVKQLRRLRVQPLVLLQRLQAKQPVSLLVRQPLLK